MTGDSGRGRGNPEPVERLIAELTRMPGVGRRSAERISRTAEITATPIATSWEVESAPPSHIPRTSSPRKASIPKRVTE